MGGEASWLCLSVQRASDGGAVVVQMRLGSRVGCVNDGVRAADWGAGVLVVRQNVGWWRWWRIMGGV